MVNCNLYGATNASPDFVKWARHQSLVFTNISTDEAWDTWLTNHPAACQVGSPDFFLWASNQWTNFKSPLAVETWRSWSAKNLTDN